MDTLFNMRAFVCVAETGSFTAAAQRMSLTTSYVSRAVATLETHLRTRLLHRTTRRIALTEAGQRYLLRCEQILAYIDEAEAEASEANAHPVGVLKVHAMTGIGQHYLIKAIAEYQQKHADVGFELTLANRNTDLLDEGYDLSVVIASELPDSGFISKHLGSTYSVLCASPAYLARQGVPRQVSELGAHHCLRLVNNVMGLDKWLFDGPDGRRFVIFRLGNRTYRCHADTVKVFLTHGVWDPFPAHLDANPRNDSLGNIRPSNDEGPGRPKRTSGAYRNPKSDSEENAWRACISVRRPNGDQHEVSLGTFPTHEEAHAAYLGAKRFMEASDRTDGFRITRRKRLDLSTRSGSGFAGVYYHPHSGRYAVNSRVSETGRKSEHIGYADTPHEGARMYRAWLRENGLPEVRESLRSEVV